MASHRAKEQNLCLKNKPKLYRQFLMRIYAVNDKNVRI